MGCQPVKSQIPEIWETDDDKKLSTFDLKTKYKKYIQSHFQGRQYFNKDTELWISVSSDSVYQWVKKSRTREKIIVIQILDFMLENGKYDGNPLPDRKNRTEIEHYMNYVQPVLINGKCHNAILKIVKPVNKDHKFYYLSLESL